MVIWDMSDEQTKIVQQQDANMKESEDDDDPKKLADKEEDTNTVQKFKHAVFSSIKNNHKAAINDLKWVPKGVKVDRKQAPDGNIYYFATCSEDGMMCIWDIKHVAKEVRFKNQMDGKDTIWEPLIKI